MSGNLKLNTALGGSIALTPTNTASNITVTIPATTGTLLTTATAGVPIGGPAFSAYLSTNQSIANSTYTKVQCNVEEFDINSNYDATNYRFTPTVAGYYQVNGGTQGAVASISYETLITIYKNGVEVKRGGYVGNSAGSTTASHVNASALIYLNGTTDYVELYAYYTWGTPNNGFLASGLALTYFQAFLARSAT
jgi:hypothetical protein